MNSNRNGRPIKITSGSWGSVLNEVKGCEFLGFCSGVTEVSVLLGFDAASVDNLM